MRLLLIRHGETVDNVAGVYAGVTDSALTNHGVLQASRLGAHLATGVKVDHIFSSDLQRAVQTAEAIRTAQSTSPDMTILEILREQDFGFYEGKKTFERPGDGSRKSGREAHADAHRNDPGFRDVESKASMRMRMDKFFDVHLVDKLYKAQPDHTVAIVAHGIILIYLWRVILNRFKPENIAVAQGIQLPEHGSSPSWSNTGYVDLEITPTNSCTSNQFCPSSQSAPNVAESPPGSTLDAGQSLPALEVLVSQPTAGASNKPPINSAGASVGVPEGKLAQPVKFLDMSLVVKALNNRDHLNGLKKSGGGLGNLKHDSSQKTMDSFFKKRRLE